MTTVVVNTQPIVPLADVETFTVDAGSPALVPGNCVCLTTTGTVTLAVAAALAAANAVLGVCITGGVPGATVQVRENGFLSPTISGLGGAGLVRVNPATGNLQIVGSYAGTDYPMGGSTSTGWLTMQRTLPSGSSGFIAGNDLSGTSSSQTVVQLSSASPIPVATALTFGANPATIGGIRSANNTTVSAARNAANSGNIPLLGTDASNNINLGDSAGAQGALTVINGTTGLSFKSAGTQLCSLAAASGDFIALGASPSASGVIRLTNNQSIVGKRPGGTDTILINVDSSDTVNVGSASQTGQLNLNSAAGIIAQGSSFHVSVSNFIIRDPAIGGVSCTWTGASAGVNTINFASGVTEVDFQSNAATIFALTPTQFIAKKGVAYAGLSSKSANYTLTNADAVITTATTGIIFQVPPSPTVGQKHTFVTQFTNGTSNIKINPNGATLFQGTNSVTTTTTVNITTAFFGVVAIMWDGAAWTLSFGW